MKRKNVSIDNNAVFNQDILNSGKYLYKSERLSCKLSNIRFVQGIQETTDCRNKHIFDVGCGDGLTLDSLYQITGVCGVFTGIDPAKEAVKAANDRFFSKYKMKEPFEVGDVYTYKPDKSYDIVLFSGTLHHMEDPKKALYCARDWGTNMLIIEPNGANPVLKCIEKFSKYHREHGERSFFYSSIKRWLKHADFQVVRVKYINLVPMFCPDWMAKICKFFEPIVEHIPIIRTICCGQIIIYAEKVKRDY